MDVIGLKNCDGTRRALRALTDAGIAHHFRDIRENPLSREEVSALLRDLGEAAINRRSTTWRGLDEVARAGDAADLILAHPTLMKRPGLFSGGRYRPGWGDGLQALLLGKGG